MKKVIYIFASLLLTFLINWQQSFAQDYTAAPVSVSKEKVKIGGKIYYSHIVLEKQTVFSISKAYETTADEIYAANPGLKESGLKKNAVILIPIQPEQDVNSAREETDALKKESAPETNSALAVEKTEAEKPEPSENERTEAKVEKKKKSKTDKDGFLIHTVRWYEDLDVISEKYGVPVSLIMEVNDLTGRKLKNRQKLRIPADIDSYIGQTDESSSSLSHNEKTENPDRDEKASGNHENLPENDVITAEKLRPAFSENSVNAVLMLPLNAQDTLGGSKSSFDFYSGALIAVKEAGKEGINVDLSVYDVAGGSLPITVERLEKTDVVIGPVAPAALEKLLSMTPQSTYVVSPLDHRAESLATTHRNFIQAPASYSTQYAELIRWMSEEKQTTDRVLVIYEKSARKNQDINILTEKLAESGMDYESFSYSILEGRNILDSLRHKMTQTHTNHVLVASESEAFVNDVVRNINLMIYNKFKVMLYAPSRIRSFETIEVENLHNANLHVTSSYYIDYNTPEVMAFIKTYRALYQTEPTPFAFQGYDIMNYFISVCNKYGKSWTDYLSEDNAELLQSGFRFKRTRVGLVEIGYKNTASRRIIYGPDYSISLVKDL